MDRAPGLAIILPKRQFVILDRALGMAADAGADHLIFNHALLRSLLVAFVAVQTPAGKVAELHSSGTRPSVARVRLARRRRSVPGHFGVVGATLVRTPSGRIRAANDYELAAPHRVVRNHCHQRRFTLARASSNLVALINIYEHTY